MWNRAGLKDNAKSKLKNYYWPAFLVCIVVGIFNSGGGSGAGSGFNGLSTVLTESSTSGNYGSVDLDILFTMMSILIGIVLIAITISFVIKLLVANPLVVGKNRYFMCNTIQKMDIGELGFAYNKQRFGNIIKTMILVDVFVFLWSLLFIIPGIIKSYEYAMVPYILAENPQIETRRAFELSKEMMRGEKWNYFVLKLSFIGWYIAGFALCCIGVLFVPPYLEATLAEFYSFIREKMIDTGFSNRLELVGFTEGVIG